MLESLEIENFRGIKKLKIDNFKNINFFIGKANTSKTSILEAIYTGFSRDALLVLNLLDARSTSENDDAFESLFYDHNANNIIKINSLIDNELFELEISSNYKDYDKLTVSIDNIESVNKLNYLVYKIKNKKGYDTSINKIEEKNDYKFEFKILNKEENIQVKKHDVGFISVFHYTNSIPFIFKAIFSDNEKRNIFKNICRQFDSKINDIIFVDDQLMIEIKDLKHTINIKNMGQGFQKYLTIAASMIYKRKYIIIDEIENGMHFESIKILLENILSLSQEYGLQFFITTHNKELLEILNDCLIEKDYKDMLSVYNVYYNKENNIDVINYSQDNFSNLIENNNEMRD